MHTIKYRMTGENLCPRRTKLEIPGWAGQPEPRVDGSHEYAWHCVPFLRRRNMASRSFTPMPTSCASRPRMGGWCRRRFRPPPSEVGLAAFSHLRGAVLHLSNSARFEGRSGFRGQDRTASEILHRPNRQRADRRAGAHPELVADAVFHRFQITPGRPRACLSAGRALRAVHDHPGGVRF